VAHVLKKSDKDHLVMAVVIIGSTDLANTSF